jgi:hypothetical protein
MTTTVTARQRWTDAVWESGDLTPLEKLTALCFASFAGKSWPRSWVAGAALRGRTGLSRDASNRAVRGLEVKGWLTPIGKAGRAHRSVLYLLDVPAAFRQAESERSGRRNREVPGDVTEPLQEPRQQPRLEKHSPSIAGRSTALDEDFPNAQNLRRIQDQGHDQAEYDVVAWARRHVAEHGSTNPNQVLGALMKTIEGEGFDRAEAAFCEAVMRVVQDGSNGRAVVHAPSHP